MRNIRFVGNLILSTSCDFYYNDFIMTLFINTEYGDVALKASRNEQRSDIRSLWAN